MPDNSTAITDVHRAAFPTDAEARLVELLIQRGRAAISLVAIASRRVVGHILFSPITIDGFAPPDASPPHRVGLGLAPLAVLPEYQNRGIGSGLVRAGLEECRRMKCPLVVVLGDPAYYSRFGFQPASRWNLTSEFGGGDAFQLLPLNNGVFPPAAASRLVRYAREFTELFGPPE